MWCLWVNRSMISVGCFVTALAKFAHETLCKMQTVGKGNLKTNEKLLVFIKKKERKKQTKSQQQTKEQALVCMETKHFFCLDFSR